ncbi:ABC transporter ATP-binding protein [Arthrobacter sp. W4I7]|uniref:ABC transporter ATP-binding protein n=1 Tax=Arthrobacter sp. W4I7 TaxID=3042296 RepID=UPI00277E25A4|nr:ABC transporter ATP-binding protein [Arthrobacter sp. W4I7]MDQ0693158.1 ABC-type dipeptide/oligopeptide/nickel transport system ATPase component [Arthrobacter sp. W4I7]
MGNTDAYAALSDVAKTAEPMLSVANLSVKLPTGSKQFVQAVRSVDLTVHAGERVGIVGESGSGKSVTVRALSGLLPESPLVDVQGSIKFRGTELLGGNEKSWRDIRAKRIGMIFQDPSSFLNPTMRIGKQVHEAVVRGRSADKSATETMRCLELAGLPSPLEVARRYPFELSGGMRQRVLIAIALAKSPELLIADEPTTALDATVQRRVLKSLDKSVEELGTSLLLITHDLAVVAGLCDRIYVMYRGEIVESGSTEKIFYDPEHSYTKELLRCVKSLSDDSPHLYVSEYANRP